VVSLDWGTSRASLAARSSSPPAAADRWAGRSSSGCSPCGAALRSTCRSPH